MNNNHKSNAKLFKALGDENRLLIISMLLDGERCACDILEELKITQPTLSHHMKILCDVGIVDSCKDGKWMHYSICLEMSKNIRHIIESYTVSHEQEKRYKKCNCQTNN